MKHTNNFDFLRLLFSTLVLFSHSYPLTGNMEILTRFFNQTTFGAIAVEAFFIMSGYLIFISLQNSPTIINYLWKRILRIFPALAVMLLATIILLPVLNPNVFNEHSYYTYFFNNLSLFAVQYPVTGIFGKNPYPSAINGSLWSLAYEFSMYIVIIPLFFFRKKILTKYILALVFLFSFYTMFYAHKYFFLLLSFINIDSYLFFKLATYFSAGALLSTINIQKHKRAIQIFSIVILIGAFGFNLYNYVAPVVLPLFVIAFAIDYYAFLQLPKKLGDISYGVYIYAFPIQQTLMHFFDLSVFTLFIYSFFITVFFAFLSWHLIEKKALKLKKIF